SCVVDPETTGGPYYVNGLIQRSNMTENQPGVALVLDVSVVDIATCSPLVNAAVEFWSCNATGYYSGFTGVSPRTGQLVGSCVNGGGSGGGGGCMTDELTFLRGLILTDSNGVAEVTTIFPGYYVGRTPHIHVTVHTGGSVGPDGTYVGGALRHVGQLFPGDDAAAAVYAAAPSLYGTAGTDFLRLAGDSIAMGGGYAGKGVLSLSSLGPSISQGLIGAVTIYVDAA
ncbi:Intradiol ring-cleavage dioxygenase, partial [Zopfochytrium polystomum]